MLDTGIEPNHAPCFEDDCWFGTTSTWDEGPDLYSLEEELAFELLDVMTGTLSSAVRFAAGSERLGFVEYDAERVEEWLDESAQYLDEELDEELE